MTTACLTVFRHLLVLALRMPFYLFLFSDPFSSDLVVHVKSPLVVFSLQHFGLFIHHRSSDAFSSDLVMFSFSDLVLEFQYVKSFRPWLR